MTSSAAHRSVGFVWQCAWRCVPTKGRGKMKSAEKKLRKKSRAGSCQTLAVPESSQAGSQRPAWGVLVSRSMEDVTHAAPSSVCVCSSRTIRPLWRCEVGEVIMMWSETWKGCNNSPSTWLLFPVWLFMTFRVSLFNCVCWRTGGGEVQQKTSTMWKQVSVSNIKQLLWLLMKFSATLKWRHTQWIKERKRCE